MITIDNVIENYRNYLTETADRYNSEFFKLNEENRKDEAVFAKIKESATANMVVGFLNISVSAAKAYYGEIEDRRYEKDSLFWKEWHKETGPASTVGERIYKLHVLGWIPRIRKEAAELMKLHKEHSNNSEFFKEKSKLDVVNETLAVFKSMFRELPTYNKSWDSRHSYSRNGGKQ